MCWVIGGGIMSPSKQKYKEAVQAAKDLCSGNITGVPEHFDERQRKIFDQKSSYFKHQFDYWGGVNNDLYLAYTGKTAEEYHANT